MENQKGFKISQYACAVLLIVSSIALVSYQECNKRTVPLLHSLSQRKASRKARFFLCAAT